MNECLTCHGTYEPTQRDGTQYFHVCPPLSAHEIAQQLDAGTLELTPRQRAELDAATKADADPDLPKGEISRRELAIASFAIARTDHRDENIVAGAVPATDKRKAQPAVLRSEGKGARKIA